MGYLSLPQLIFSVLYQALHIPNKTIFVTCTSKPHRKGKSTVRSLECLNETESCLKEKKNADFYLFPLLQDVFSKKKIFS